MSVDESSILVPHRCVGRVFGERPAAYFPIQTSAVLGYISFPINNSVFTYKIRPLTLAWVSEPVASNVRVVVRDKKRVFAADDDGIDVLNFNGTRLKRLLHKKLQNPINFLICIGNFLVCIETNGFITVVDVISGEVLVEIETPSNFVVSSAMHPDTFYNKIVLGSTDGRIRIVNINTAKLVHEFQQDALFNCEITCIVQSPAKDVLALGMKDGNVHFRNLKSGDVLFSFRQDGAVTGISFRTDGIETMATTNSEGTVALWNLNERLLIGQKVAAHSGKIHSVFFLLGQPNMITCGEDNKIARWFMETEISLPVPSKVIEGHRGEVTAIKFATDTSILSSGVDGHVRKFNIYRSDRISQLGVAREVKKSEISKNRFIDVRMEPIVDMKLEKMREHVWDNVACVHKDSPLVSTWSSRRYTKGTHLFCHDRFTKDGRFLDASVTAIEMTNSGDLCLVGYSTGHIDVYSMQSGKYKFSLDNPKFKLTKEDSSVAHKKSIVAIFSYLNSRNVVTVSANGTIGWWEIESAARLKKFIDCGEKASVAAFSRESRLLAIGLHETGGVQVLDADTGATARVFQNIARDENDFTLLEFSNNSAYLLTADNSGIIRLIDLKSATLIGSLRCSNPCKKAVFSANDLYVATCHENQPEIFIWTNRSKYASVHHQTRLDENLPIQTLSCFAPNVIEDEADFDLNDDEETSANKEESRMRRLVIDDDESDIEVLNESIEIDVAETEQNAEEKGLFTLSGQPSHRWAVLPYIDVIKSRNTIHEVVKKPINVPFFLESTPNELDIIVAEQGRKIALADHGEDEIWTEWAKKLSSATVSGDFVVCFNSLIALSTPQIDAEIRSLPTSLTISFIRMLLAKLDERAHLDFVQAILCTFIRVHRDRIAQQEMFDGNTQSENQENIAVPLAASDLTNELDELHNKLTDSTAKLEQLYVETLPVLKWIKSALI